MQMDKKNESSMSHILNMLRKWILLLHWTDLKCFAFIQAKDSCISVLIHWIQWWILFTFMSFVLACFYRSCSVTCFSIINKCWTEECVHLNLCTMERDRLYFGRILWINHWWQTHSFFSMFLSMYSMYKSMFSWVCSLFVNFSFSSLSLIHLYFYYFITLHYFVFLSFKHLFLNHNHRSSIMFFMII